MGTLSYMSPEQIQGEKVDHRTDIWSVGVTLHEMLTGQLPFQGDYEAAIMYAILHEAPQPLETYRPELPEALQSILDRAMEQNCADRYQSIRELITDLKALGEAGPAEPQPRTPDKEVKKAGYLPDYANDVFVSYANIDDKSLTEGQKGWIANFHQALEVRLEQLLGADTKVWRKDKEPGKGSGKKTHATACSDTAILVSIVSPQYVKSAECLQEVKDFYEFAEKDKGVWLDDRARIFKAVKTFVPRDAQPVELQEIPDYEFYEFDQVSGRPQEFIPELGSEAKRNFWAKLEDIAYDIYQLMETLKASKTGAAKKSARSVPTIYLAETTNDLSSHRDKIKRQLQQRGYVIIPERPLPLSSNDLQKRIRADLERASLSIHLIGENYGIVPEGEMRSIAEIQHDLAVSHSMDEGFSRLIWIPPGLRAQDERQQRLIDALTKGESAQVGADLLQTSLGEFKTFLMDKLSAKPEDAVEKSVEEDIIRVYLQCDQKDLDDTAPLEEYLFDQGLEIKLPAFEGDEVEVFEAHKENLLLCDATIIYYGNTTDSWLTAKLGDLQKIAGYGRKKPMKAKAIYLAAPKTKHKERFRTREALAIKNFEDFSPDALLPFLEAVKNGKGA